jgi:S1-C subfamily serine protease
MAVNDELRHSDSGAAFGTEGRFDHYTGSAYEGIPAYTKTERERSVTDSAHLTSRGVVGNVQLAQAVQPAPKEYDPTIEELREDIRKRGETPATIPECDKRPQSSDVAPIENTCGADLQSKVPEAEKSIVQVINPEIDGLGNGVYACKSDGSFCGVITNDHVVPEGSGNVLVQQGDRDALGTRVASDPEHDLSLLKLSGGDVAPKPAPFATKLNVRDPLFAVCRLDDLKTVSTGTAMDLSTNMGSVGRPSTPSIGSLQVTFPGCSGTANFTASGEIAGIVKGGRNLSFGLGITGSVLGSQARDLIESYVPPPSDRR